MIRTSLMIVALLSSVSSADPKKPSADDMKQMMATMEKNATPGPEHKALAESVGTWTTASKMWMDPSAPPMESQGTEEVTPLLGGRFVQMHFSGQMMGKPFEGIGIEGYDNAKKKWVMSWMDSMGTGIITAEGTGDIKSRTFTGEELGPDGKKHGFRWVIKSESPKKHVMEMYSSFSGKEMKEGEITYTRK